MFFRGLTAEFYGSSYGIRRDTGDMGKTGKPSQFVRYVVTSKLEEEEW